MRSMRSLAITAALVGLVLGIGSCAAPTGGSARPPDPLLAQTRLPDLQGGNPVTLSEWVSPQGLLLVFVDLTCPYAEQTIAELPQVTAVLSKHRLPALVLNLDQPLEDVQKYYARKQLGAKVLYDTTHDTWERWKLEQVPALVLVDRAGQVAYRGNGEWDKLKSAVARQLALSVRDLNFGAKGTEDG